VVLSMRYVRKSAGVESPLRLNPGSGDRGRWSPQGEGGRPSGHPPNRSPWRRKTRRAVRSTSCRLWSRYSSANLCEVAGKSENNLW